nr:HAMP domain-containing sensor histidine kinase [uncultured Sellimonas sp.]
MLAWTIAATVTAIVVISVFIAYRQQVKKICRRLTFLKAHKTNMCLTSDLPFRELNNLTDDINDILEMARDMQKLSRQKEESLKETITNLSHDIRTPLTSMDGYFQLLARSSSEEERRHYIAVIQSRITSLKDMLEELFTYTKLQNETFRLELKSLDFGKVVFDTVFSFYDEFQRKGIEPKIDFCEGHLPVIGNYEAIRRALQNIIKNALEHGEKQIVFELKRDDTQAVFCCMNDVENPDGIDMTQIFSRFYKADTARSNTSTGLGLSIAKGLIERMNGVINARLQEDIFIVEIRFLIQDLVK